MAPLALLMLPVDGAPHNLLAPRPARQCQCNYHCRCRRVCCRVSIFLLGSRLCNWFRSRKSVAQSLVLRMASAPLHAVGCGCGVVLSWMQLVSVWYWASIHLADSGGIGIRLDCGEQYGERWRSLSLVCRAGAEDVFAITLNSPWPIYHSLSMLWGCHERSSSGQMRRSSYSSVWKGSSLICKASVHSGDTQTIEGLWELYFADASQWWDNRVDKKNPRTPDFKHKVTRKGLWIDDWSTPAWVKARLKSASKGRLQCHAGYGTRDPQDTAQGRRLVKGNNGEENAVPTSARKLTQIAQGGGGSMHLQSASTIREAIDMLGNRLQQGITIDSDMYVEVLQQCLKQKDGVEAKQVHDCIIKSGMDQTTYVVNNLLNVYIKCGRLQDARQLFDGLLRKNVVSWNTMIGGYAQRSHAKDAMGVFHQMLQAGGQPNAITYLSILKGCASAGALEWVKEVHSHALEAGCVLDVRVGNALVHVYAKSGSIEDARLVFDRMEKRDVVTWNTMIGGLAQHGCGHEALEVFRRMYGEGVKADGTSFVAVLSACSHAGLVEDGHRLFVAMTQDYGIEPTVVHCNCMVDLLGRAGYLEEAKLFICNMPIEPNGATWTALLGACRTYGNVELGELAAKENLKFEPTNASTYVILSNIYAAAGKWEEVSLVRRMMQDRGIRKEPGRSWIEVDDKIHGFVVGDTSHPEAKEIYAELEGLTERIKAEGYIPDTRLVLENIDEEDKERALCAHSEKLAITYGLIHIPHGKPIRVYKNLRVCSDCHTATKFISKVTGREIVARDANRFHHFNNGVCSCGDYW